MSSVLIVLLSVTFATAQSPKPKPDPAQSMAAEADLATLGPVPGIMAGVIANLRGDRGSVERSAPPINSPAREQLMNRLYESWRSEIAKLDFDAMGLDDRVDYLLLKNRLDYDIRKLGLDAKKRAAVAPLVPFASLIFDLDAERRRLERPNGRHAAEVMDDLAKHVETTKKQVEASR